MRIGIDLGGSKIELLALDQHGTEMLRVRQPTPAADYQATVTLIATMVQQAERQLQATASTVGIGTPGAVSLKTGRMKNCNSTCLNGQPLTQDIEQALQRHVRLSNDANCFALSEARDGAGEGADVLFGVILGTGVGGGLVVHGQVLDGANHIAGEWGHNPLPFLLSQDRPEPCYCGQQGCIETWLSGPAMSAAHERRTGKRLAPASIAACSDSDCQQTLESYCQHLAAALAGVINIIDPDVIVLGGGLSNIKALYSRVPAFWAQYVFSDDIRTRLLPPKHGDASGVRGAAWL